MAKQPESKLAAAVPEGTHGAVCSVRKFLEEYAHEADALRAMIADTTTWTGAQISRTVRAEIGVHLSASAINRHRKHDCKCEVSA